ncbi:hypothetical protein LTR86_005478 [Recurvomyces mirabilis]|nr:hypothetical protein LTR86_005478 [Recurvomyces mirabilis]
MEEKACAEEEAMVIEIDSAPGVPGTVFVEDYDRIQEDQPEEAHETMQMVEGVVGKQGQGAEPLFDHSYAQVGHTSHLPTLSQPGVLTPSAKSLHTSEKANREGSVVKKETKLGVKKEEDE